MARQKEFDPDTALARAVSVFWRKGYEGTSMKDLVDEMGVHKRSMYDTYGDKRSLFLKAVARYAEHEEEAQRDLVRHAASPLHALRELLGSSIHVGADQPPGCLMVNCATELAPHDAQVAARVREHFQFAERLLTEVIRAGQADGTMRKAMEPADAGRLIFNMWLGVRVQVRAGVAKAQLEHLVESAVAWVT
ncbi:MAG TPA: TetR/AcrR family transcriptional regulator [Luteibacter sp.]|nr:TetR/AcrR family transcriptional regulator [Luteibacter sp.]